MGKRAAIYVRVSTEKQAERVSPETQEKDSRARCAEQGYELVEVYRDVEKYRVGNRLVEPSSTRNDRPAWRRMLADVDAGKVDMIIAWRTDRLYRGINRATLEIMERVSDGRVEVELVKDHFDPKTAPVLAWAAGIELQARADRTIMGVAGRLAQGKVWLSNSLYGYDYAEGALLVNDREKELVQNVWRWYGSGETMRKIRERLIAGGYPQKGRTIERKHVWSLACIKAILKRDAYYTGILKIEWDDETYEIGIEPIIDAELYGLVQKRRREYVVYPAGNLKAQALAAGKVYCKACNVRMSAIGSKSANGKKYPYYRCNNNPRFVSKPGCAKCVSLGSLDDDVWAKVWDLISNPDKLEGALRARIEQLQAQETDAGAECKKLERQIGDLTEERQMAIGLALKKIITEADLKKQLGRIDQDLQDRRRRLGEMRIILTDSAGRLVALARNFTRDVREGYENINIEPASPEEAALVFAARKGIIDRYVVRVEVNADKTTEVYTIIDLEGPAGGSGEEPGNLSIRDKKGRSNILEVRRVEVSIVL